ncbi:MAG: DNA translocase FtsK 4TM domain-containing protein, partial [Cytophagaceae bacterium]
MAENTYKQPVKNKIQDKGKEKKGPKRSLKFSLPVFFKDKRLHLAVAFFLIVSAFFLLLAFTSFMFSGKNDQSIVEALYNTEMRQAGAEIQNWLGISGAYLSYYFIYKWFGIASFAFLPILFLLGLTILVKNANFPLYKIFTVCLFFVLWTSPSLGYVVLTADTEFDLSMLSGGIGYETAVWLNDLIGVGTPLLLLFILLVFNIYYFNITSLFRKNEENVLADEGVVPVPGTETDDVLDELLRQEAEDYTIEDELDEDQEGEEDDDEEWILKNMGEQKDDMSRPIAAPEKEPSATEKKSGLELE